MWHFILLLGAFSIDHITAEEFRRGNYLLNVDDGILRSIKPTSDSIHIDLAGLKLQQTEEKVFDSLSGVKNLNLDNNELTTLPPSIFSKLTQLETLSLANNKIDDLKENTFLGLDNLKCLNISYNSLSSLPRGVFYGLTKSVDIIIEGTKIFAISNSMFLNPAIQLIPAEPAESMDPVHTRLTKHTLPPTLDVKICITRDGIVKSLEELKKDEPLGDCKKVQLNREVGYVRIHGLRLKKFEKGWYKLSAFPVRGINLALNRLTEITPEFLNDLPAGLTGVNLAYNDIEIIRKHVIENQHLKTLNLMFNEISTIEESALANTSLIGIILRENGLRSFAFTRTLPPTLQALGLGNNSIEDIPEDFLKNLKNLRGIDLSYCNMTHFPVNTLRSLKKLEKVDLSHNQLSEIHSGTFEDQEKMIFICLEFNRITHIDSGFFRGVKAVQTIDLSHNKIKRISKDLFSELKEVSGVSIYLNDNEIEIIEKGSFAGAAVLELTLKNNRISTIQEGAFDMPALQNLELSNNSLTMIDGNSYTGLPTLRFLSLNDNMINNITKGAAKNLGNLWRLNIIGNPIERLENGALFGLSTQREVQVPFHNTSMKVIQAGLFEDV